MLVVAAGLGPGDSQGDMARAGVCSGLVLTTGLSRGRGPQGQEWGLLGERRRKTAEMGTDLAGKHTCPQSDDRMGNPFPRHSWKSTRPPATLHLQAPPELAWQAGSGFGCCWARCHGWEEEEEEERGQHSAPSSCHLCSPPRLHSLLLLPTLPAQATQPRSCPSQGPSRLGAGPHQGEGSRGPSCPLVLHWGSASFISVSSFLPLTSLVPPLTLLFSAPFLHVPPARPPAHR